MNKVKYIQKYEELKRYSNPYTYDLSFDNTKEKEVKGIFIAACLQSSTYKQPST